jgi:hypothetical protein
MPENELKHTPEPSPKVSLKSYSEPEFIIYGKVRELTKSSGRNGMVDSGAAPPINKTLV